MIRKKLLLNLSKLLSQPCTRIIPSRGYYMRLKVAEKVADLVTQNLQTEIQETNLLLFRVHDMTFPNLFKDCGFKKVFFHKTKKFAELVNEPGFVSSVPYSNYSTNDYISRVNQSGKYSPLMDSSLARGEDESLLCVVGELRKLSKAMIKLTVMLSLPKVFFPSGRVPHFFILPKKCAKILAGNSLKLNMTTLYHVIFNIEFLSEISPSQSLVRVVPRANLYTDILDGPEDLMSLYYLGKFLFRQRNERLIPELEMFFPGIGLTLLDAGFVMQNDIEDLDFTQLHLFLKLLKTFPDFSLAMCEKLFRTEESSSGKLLGKRWG